MLITGPPISASPRPPEVVKTISAALPTSTLYIDVPPPLSVAADAHAVELQPPLVAGARRGS